MSQLTYNLNPAKGTAGMVSEYRTDNQIISKVAEGLVPVGLLADWGTQGEVGPPLNTVSQDSANPGQVKRFPLAVANDPLLDSDWMGIPVYDSSRPPYTALNEYSDKDYVPVLRRGSIWVLTENSSAEGDDVYVRVAVAGPLTVIGGFSSGAGPGKALFPKGRWRSSTNTAGLAILEVL